MNEKLVRQFCCIIILILGMTGILTHEWWRDEAYTLIAERSAKSIDDLYFLVSNNGHPFGYYLFQYFLNSLSDTKIAFSVVNLIFAAGSVYLYASSRFFSTAQRLLFPFGFFIVYQYGVMARGYSCLVFFLFLYCWLREKSPSMTFAPGICLLIMSQIHFFGCIASGSILMFELLTECQDYTSRRSFERFVISRIIVLLVLCFTVFIVYSKSGAGLHQNYSQYLLAGLSGAMLPETGILSTFKELAILGLALWCFALFEIANRDIRIFLVYLLLIFPLMIFFILITPGHRWHFGFYFIFYIIAIWIVGSKLKTHIFPRFCVLTVISFIHACLGVYSISLDILYPYSNGERVADYIRRNKLDGLPIVSVAFRSSNSGRICSWDTGRIQSVLLELRDKQVFNFETGDFQRLHKYRLHGPVAEFPCNDLGKRLDKIAHQLGSSLLVTICGDFGEVPTVTVPEMSLLLQGVPVFDFGETIGLYQFQLEQA